MKFADREKEMLKNTLSYRVDELSKAMDVFKNEVKKEFKRIFNIK